MGIAQERAEFTERGIQPKDAGVTQVELGERIGQRQTFVSKFELGERRLDVAEFIEICRVIGVDPVKIMKSVEQR